MHVEVYIQCNSCRPAWVLQLLCWKYSDLCTLGMLLVHVCNIQDTLVQTCCLATSNGDSRGAYMYIGSCLETGLYESVLYVTYMYIPKVTILPT